MTRAGVNGHVFNPSHPRLHGVVHRSCFGVESSGVSHLRDTVFDSLRVMDPQGFEPWASSLQRRHSTTELWAHSQSSN